MQKKFILIRHIPVVNCPKHKRIVPVGRVNVTDDKINCQQCVKFDRETCTRVKCGFEPAKP